MFQWTGSDSKNYSRIQRAACVTALAAVFFLSNLLPGYAQESVWTPLVDRLVVDGFDEEYISSVFKPGSPSFSPMVMAKKMNALLHTKLTQRRTGSAGKPAVMDRYINPILIAGAYAFFREHRELYISIEEQLGVSGDVLTALMLVETKLGTQVGRHNALTILGSMALAKNFELIQDSINRQDLSDEMQGWLVKRTGQKADWAYKELKSLLTYALQSHQDPAQIPSSMYGAIGMCQFIPSSALYYGIDGSGDGIVDLFDVDDALFSMANFLSKHGWKQGLGREAQLKVVYRYNHSESYAMTILAVAEKIRKTAELFGN